MQRLIHAVTLLTLSTLLLDILANFTARREPRARYNTVRVYVLAATWVPSRAANAASLCATVTAAQLTHASGLKEVTCVVTPGVRGAVATEDDVRAFEAEGLISFAPLPPPPFWRRALVLPRLASPLLPEFPVNSLVDTRNGRRRQMVANTVGVLRALQGMARDAAIVDAGSQARTLYVFFEDDADLGAYGSGFPGALLETSTRLPRAWDMLLLAPPPGLCERAAGSLRTRRQAAVAVARAAGWSHGAAVEPQPHNRACVQSTGRWPRAGTDAGNQFDRPLAASAHARRKTARAHQLWSSGRFHERCCAPDAVSVHVRDERDTYSR